MKKFFLVATAPLLFTGVSFADNGKNKGKKKKSGKCCKKDASSSCNKSKDKTAQL